MILALDAGNTNIVAGCIDGEKILFIERIKTDTSKTELEYIVLFQALMHLHKIANDEIEGAIISSVVPPLNNIITGAVRKMFGIEPQIICPGIKTGLRIMVDDPATVGSDLIADTVAGLEYYGAPLIIIDMGTATTVTVLDKDKSFIGGAIMPGVGATMDALVSRTSQLPRIALEAPRKIIGTNTVDCMKSGIIIAQAAAMDGMIDRMWKELGYETKVVATGGLASSIVPNCSHDIIIDNELILKGLKVIYEKNK
ncbi:MAG: type III pantothenate kinase [Clostridia bacterium]|nr:type III pantothenate kinase [Clostridia bacterium]